MVEMTCKRLSRGGISLLEQQLLAGSQVLPHSKAGSMAGQVCVLVIRTPALAYIMTVLGFPNLATISSKLSAGCSCLQNSSVHSQWEIDA
jgi:hypothetical protein